MKKKLKEEVLKTLKHDTKAIKNKINIHGEADDKEFNFLEEKLEDLIQQIDMQIKARKVVDRKLKQLQRGKMMVWNCSVKNYIDFK